MVVLFILLIIGGGIFFIFNIFEYFSGGMSRAWKFIIWYRFLKTVKGDLLNNGFEVKRREIMMWEQTEFGDYEIELHLVDKTRRSSRRFDLVVDNRGFLVKDSGNNGRFLDMLNRS